MLILMLILMLKTVNIMLIFNAYLKSMVYTNKQPLFSWAFPVHNF